jgi:hypothetical protein
VKKTKSCSLIARFLLSELRDPEERKEDSLRIVRFTATSGAIYQDLRFFGSVLNWRRLPKRRVCSLYCFQ